METKRTKTDDWIKLASKSRPGRFYLFNKSTGETQWVPQTQDPSTARATTSGSRNESPPKFPVSKLQTKNPAQDRLKRLQNNLKANQIRAQSSKANAEDEKIENSKAQERLKRLQNNLKANQIRSQSSKANAADEKIENSKEKQNRSNDLPSTSSQTKSKPKSNTSSPGKLLPSPRKASKRTHSALHDTARETEQEILPTQNNKKILRLSESLNTSITTVSNRESNTSIYDVAADRSTKDLQNDNTKSSTFNSLRAGIVNKIKEICKIPFSTTSKKSYDEMAKAIEHQSSSSSNSLHTTSLNRLDKSKKDRENKQHLSASLKEALSQLRAENDKSTKQVTVEECSTLKNLSVPTYQRGSANTRLERLRQSLQLQQPSTSETGPSALTVANNTNLNINLINPLHQSVAKSSNDEVESMDWQTTITQDPIEIFSTDCIVSNKLEKTSMKRFNHSDETTMGDIYDTVNSNLLRVSAEKQKITLNNNNKWQKENFYFIVDTNVLLRDLCFIEDLSKMKLCDTKGSMLYIPYCVLQELDALKMRSGCRESVKTLAVRAIKYLNKKFENKSENLQAQSALEERNHLIEINSADDSIINCCLQAKEHVPNILLLTEDVNLRNKAICNSILVSTKSDLVTKRYDENEKS